MTIGSLCTSLFPEELIEFIGNESSQGSGKCIFAVATLAANCVLRAEEAWREGSLKKLDPNPGDGGCQMRGYLHQLVL